MRSTVRVVTWWHRDPRRSVEAAARRSRALSLGQIYELKSWGLAVADAQARGAEIPPWPESLPRPLDINEFNAAYDAAVADVDPVDRLGALTRADLRLALIAGIADEAERAAYTAVLGMQSAELQAGNLGRATWALVAATIALAAATVALVVVTLVNA